MAKGKFELSQKLDLVGVVDVVDDDKLVFIVEDGKEEVKEIDALDILNKIVGYNIKISADFPIEV